MPSVPYTKTKITPAGKKIKKFLLENNLFQSQLATRCGVSPGWFSNLVTGRSSSVAVQKALARILGMTYDELWGDHSEDNGEEEGGR